jgi:hypothetical protein
MDEQVHFASLLFASQIGILDRVEVIQAADQRIIELEKPEFWLIELSAEGGSGELEGLIVSADERVYLETLRLAYHAWVEGKISDARFLVCCNTLWKQAGCHSRWYADLVWIDDEFDLVDQGILRREDSKAKIRSAIERILQR